MKLYPLFEDTDYPTDALIARVSAGEAVEIGDDFERVDLNYMLAKGNPNCMLIRVRGDSMSDEISDGDWVMIDRKRVPEPGNIVLAQIGGGFTIKRHKHLHDDAGGKNGLYLVPANRLYETRRVESGDGFEVVGVVTHIIHQTV